MKKVLLLSIVLLFGASAHASEWLHDYDDALGQAKKSGKTILMVYTMKT